MSAPQFGLTHDQFATAAWCVAVVGMFIPSWLQRRRARRRQVVADRASVMFDLATARAERDWYRVKYAESVQREALHLSGASLLYDRLVCERMEREFDA